MNYIFIIILIILIFIVIYIFIINQNNQNNQNNQSVQPTDYSKIENIKNISLINVDANIADIASNITTVDFLNKSSVNQTNKPLVEPTVDQTNKPLVEPTVDQTNKPLVEPTVNQTNKPLVEPTVDQTNKPIVDSTSKQTIELSDDKRCYIIELYQEYLIKDIQVKYNFINIVGYVNYMYDMTEKYKYMIVYNRPSEIKKMMNIIRLSDGIIKGIRLIESEKIHYNGMNYKKYMSDGLIKTTLLMMIGSFERLGIKDIGINSIKIRDYDIINVEGYKWEYIENLINKFAIYNDTYQVSLYLYQ